MYRQVSYTEARNNLSEILGKVCADHEPTLIARRNGGNAVVVSEEDWNALQETLYLMGNGKDWKAISDPAPVEECSDTLPW